MYVVKFLNRGDPYYLADWEGDPGRTKKIESALKFQTDEEAREAANKAVDENPVRYMDKSGLCKIIKLTTKMSDIKTPIQLCQQVVSDFYGMEGANDDYVAWLQREIEKIVLERLKNASQAIAESFEGEVLELPTYPTRVLVRWRGGTYSFAYYRDGCFLGDGSDIWKPAEDITMCLTIGNLQLLMLVGSQSTMLLERLFDAVTTEVGGGGENDKLDSAMEAAKAHLESKPKPIVI